jgi:hypothetical protein
MSFGFWTIKPLCFVFAEAARNVGPRTKHQNKTLWEGTIAPSLLQSFRPYKKTIPSYKIIITP